MFSNNTEIKMNLFMTSRTRGAEGAVLRGLLREGLHAERLSSLFSNVK
jgi:hypothetical protein